MAAQHLKLLQRAGFELCWGTALQLGEPLEGGALPRKRPPALLSASLSLSASWPGAPLLCFPEPGPRALLQWAKPNGPKQKPLLSHRKAAHA